jgi:enoyl-CoA hydratase
MIDYHVDGAVARLHIRRADKKNALDAAMWRTLRSQCEALAAQCAAGDPAAPRVLCLLGEPGVFSAGADIDELRRLVADPAAMAAHQTGIEAAEVALEELPVPTIAVIDGPCFGGGFGLAAACDFRVASSRASFAVTPSRLGLIYSVTDTRRLLRVLGDHAARRLLMRAERLDAATALSWGFLDELVEPPALAECAARWAAGLETASRSSMAGTKLTLRAVDSGDTALLGQAREAFGKAFEGADFAEGAAAFLERREARFR